MKTFKIIDPKSSFKVLWDNLIILLTIILAFETPLMIVFDKPFTPGTTIFSIFVTLFFIMDMLINFQTGYYEKHHLITDKTLIKKKYLKNWFAIDLISTLPFELFSFIFPFAGLNRLFRLIKLIRLLKLYRVANSINHLKSKNILNPGVLRMLLLGFWIVIASHFISCIWIALGKVSADLTPWENYLRAVYWTITTLTTIGYGDITPSTNPQIAFTIVIQITGVGMYGFIVGNISNLIANLDIAKAQFRDQMEKINTFMKYRNIPVELQNKINNYYEYLWESRKGYDESSVLGQLPLALKTEVSLFLNKEIIEKVPIFKGASQGFIRQIILHLTPMVFTPGDYVVIKGDIGTEMYFISKGSVEVVSDDGSVVYATLSSGQFFGEIALLLSMPRTASIRTTDFCDIYKLDKQTFENVLKQYPDFESTIKEMAEKRKQELESMKK